jgi:hypothetical protein
MPESRMRFTWTLTFEGDTLMASEVEPDVKRVLDFWTRHPKYPGKFVNLEMGGMAYGFMQIKLTVIGRDQWACRSRASWISRALMSAAHVKYVEVAEPRQRRLPPHQHRGSRRFEAPKYQEAVNG